MGYSGEKHFAMSSESMCCCVSFPSQSSLESNRRHYTARSTSHVITRDTVILNIDGDKNIHDDDDDDDDVLAGTPSSGRDVAVHVLA